MNMFDLLVFFLYTFYPFQDISILGIKYFKFYYLLLLLLLYTLILLILNKDSLKIRFLYFYIPYIPFLIWMYLSILWSVKYNDSIYASLKYLIYLLIGIIISYYLTLTKNYKVILKSLYFSALIVSILYFFVFIKQGGFLLFSEPVTMATIAKIASINVGFGGGRNLLASWLSFALTFSFPFLLVNKKKWFIKIILIISFLFILFIIFLTLSRTALLAIFISFIITILLINNSKIKRYSFFLLFFSILLAIFILKTNIFNLGTFLISRFAFSIQALKGEVIDYGTLGRLELWSYALKSFFEDPIFGSGIGTLYRGLDEIGGVHNYHNIFLQFLAQTGLIGFYLFLIWTLWVLYISYLIAKCLNNLEISFLTKLVFANILTYYFKSLLMFQYFDLEIWTLIGFVGWLYYYKIIWKRRGL